MTEKFCILHETELVEDSVPILYGTHAPKREHVRTERNSIFPFSNAFVLGPCWVGEETHATVLFCPTCRDHWLKTPEGMQFVEYFAQKRPTAEQDIERLIAQQDDNARTARIYNVVRLACYVVFGATISSLFSYFLTINLAMGAVIGGIGGFIAGVFAKRRAANN